MSSELTDGVSELELGASLALREGPEMQTGSRIDARRTLGEPVVIITSPQAQLFASSLMRAQGL